MTILARMISVVDFGRISYAFNVSALLTLLLSFGIPSFVVIVYHREGPRILPEINRLAFRLVLWTLPLVAAFAVIVHSFRDITPGDLAAIALSGIAGLLVPHVSSICQAEGRWGDISRYQVFANTLRAVFVPSALLVAHPFARSTVLWASAAASLASAALVSTREQARLHLASALEALRTHLPDFRNLALTNTVLVLASRADLLLAGFLLLPDQLGAYSAASTLVLGMGIVQSAIMSISLHDAACSGVRSGLALQRQWQLLPLVVAGIFLALVLSPRGIPFVFGARYAAAVTPFKFLATTLFLGILFTPIESHFSAHATRNGLKLKIVQLCALVVFAELIGRSLAGLGAAVLLSRSLGWLWALILYRRTI
jgi:O-antigen/teichoic acid export membrane protein